MFGALLAAISPNGALAQLFPPASKFDPARDMPDLSQKIVLVTGFNSGLGFETSKRLIQRNVGKIYLAARSPKKAQEAIAELRKLYPQSTSQLVFHQLDISDLKAIRKSADEFLAAGDRLDVLFNNAGVMQPEPSALTPQGFDMQWGTNVLGPFFFTELIMPALKRSSQATGEPARIVNTSSYLHIETVPTASGVDPDTYVGGQARDAAMQKMGDKALNALYGQSKLGNIFVSDYWAQQDPQSVASCSLHPGLIRTNLVGHVEPNLQSKIFHMLGSPVELGALSQLYAGTTAKDINGKYYIPWAREGEVSGQAKNAKTRAEVIAWLKSACDGF